MTVSSTVSHVPQLPPQDEPHPPPQLLTPQEDPPHEPQLSQLLTPQEDPQLEEPQLSQLPQDEPQLLTPHPPQSLTAPHPPQLEAQPPPQEDTPQEDTPQPLYRALHRDLCLACRSELLMANARTQVIENNTPLLIRYSSNQVNEPQPQQSQPECPKFHARHDTHAKAPKQCHLPILFNLTSGNDAKCKVSLRSPRKTGRRTTPAALKNAEKFRNMFCE
ncbi:MAG: hypothetical protein R3C59_27480 [Planctomycetaceae bacterium]